jgi:hypothetical protein
MQSPRLIAQVEQTLLQLPAVGLAILIAQNNESRGVVLVRLDPADQTAFQICLSLE